MQQIVATSSHLSRYLDNILTHPGEEKYSKIRVNNKAFSEKVSGIEGAVLFMEAVGFRQKLLPHGGKWVPHVNACKVHPSVT